MGSHVTPSPGLGASTSSSSRPNISGLPSPLQANPPLIRTSTLQQTPSPATTPAGAQQSGQPFNPYTLYPHKAVLKIVGDLDSMTEGWTVDEWSANRRIVMFKRSQSGCTITTTFNPVTLDEQTSKQYLYQLHILGRQEGVFCHQRRHDISIGAACGSKIYCRREKSNQEKPRGFPTAYSFEGQT